MDDKVIRQLLEQEAGPGEHLAVLSAVPLNGAIKVAVNQGRQILVARGWVTEISEVPGMQYVAVLFDDTSHWSEFRPDYPCLMLPPREGDLEELRAALTRWTEINERVTRAMRPKP
ncbi:MAG: hypothetical protein A3J48_01435 [Candidatus Doudnabacteria bacterium RIFCSPHIGHO2_02_FULL_46_11]|uniref:Uncharacterized protein n=1 Tax=Candidatus Doudnabacteria bacterium RIFCSPHIGHO2_02_FULL_46_11 TaxID=1817832 RepID=A0A1F5P487_9BACT|nr:MAG: hypothetical protein A3J48_01435 [Candidatus Doudnabacteria bacterium RIFCSPHIGHO2_02_FULL_46_11]